MAFRNTLLVIATCLAFHAMGMEAIENSIVPIIEKYENIDNLPPNKYSGNQYAEIAKALKTKHHRIRLATYNMLFDIMDHNFDEVNQWPQRLPRIVELIHDMQPDVMGIQELHINQIEDLLVFIGGEYDFFSKPSQEGEINGIFYRKDRFDLLESKIWYMTDTPDVPAKETLTMLKLKDRMTGRPFAIFNAHLAYSAIDKREFQARFIAKLVEPIVGDMPVILTGDLNTFPNRLDLPRLPFYDGDYIHRILTQGSLRDAKDLSLVGHLGPLSTFTNGSDDGKPFQGTGTPGVILDHIYVSKGLNVLIHAVQPATVKGHFPSDHMPVLIDFTVLKHSDWPNRNPGSI